MTKYTYNRMEIGKLADRLENRGSSQILKDRPELCKDMLAAAALLRVMLEVGMPVSDIEIEIVSVN